MKARIAFLWHMHQPMYVDPATGEMILPWVRLHATHSYYDMARHLWHHPQVRATVNFVPSLLEQLDSIARGAVKERFLELAKARPSNLKADERQFIVRQFFMANPERGVKTMPRYWELLQQRGGDVNAIDQRQFSDEDLLDLQVLFNLAWMGSAARAEEPEVSRLIAKGRDFSHEDKASLLAIQQSIVQRVVKSWRELAARGQVELSSTPYYHPILPLVCDSDAARRAMPNAALPPRFTHPEDAREQVRRAIVRHEETFGSRPNGMWPAEGAVSPEALQIFAAEGIRWLATDEGVLLQSTPRPSQHGALYQAWDCKAGDGKVSMAFRDHSLSDRIGFTYARTPADEAARDFLGLLRRAESEARRIGIADPVIPVILDGENAWEHYPDSGAHFFDALYSALEKAPDLITTTMSEALKQPTAHLDQIHSGSWIDANYRIWIGHPEDNLGWELMGKVRNLVAAHETKGDVSADRIEEAKTWLLSAEGSDWFWWYGDDFQTDNAAEFDALFRERLIRAAALVGEPAPARLSEPLSRQARNQAPPKPNGQPPTALIHPRIDGHADVYTRWIGAGVVDAAGAHGSMYQSTTLIRSLRYGCDLTSCYLRLEPGEPWRDIDVSIELSNGRDSPREIVVAVREPGAQLKSPVPGAQAAYVDVVEMSLPLAALHFGPRDRAELTVRLLRRGVELERIPQLPLVFVIPDADFGSRSWVV